MTPNNHYRSTVDLVASFSAALAVSCAGICSSDSKQKKAEPFQGFYLAASPELFNTTNEFYVAAERPPLSEREQMEALEQFGQKMLRQSVELAPAAAKILNDKFWDLL